MSGLSRDDAEEALLTRARARVARVRDAAGSESAVDEAAVWDVPLSRAQRRMWLLEQLSPGTDRYNVPIASRVRGPLDVDALGRALTALTARHSVLRTRFTTGPDGEPRQTADAPAPVPVEVVDRPDGAGADALVRAAAARPFELAAGPVLRALVVRHAAEDHTVLLAFHHIAVDGPSVALIADELTVLYGSLGSHEAEGGTGDPLPAAPQYAALARREWAVPAAALAHWRERLAGAAPVRLPRPEGADAGRHGAAVQAQPLPPNVLEPLRTLAVAHRTTLFTVVLTAAYAALMAGTGQQDLLIGCASTDRDLPEAAGTVGPCVNILPLRADLSGVTDFAGALERVREVLVTAQQHRHVPLDAIVDGLGAGSRDGDGTALVSVSVDLVGPAEVLRLPGTTAVPVEVPSATAKFPFALCVEETGDGQVRALAHHNLARVSPGAARALLASFAGLLAQAADDPATPLVRGRAAELYVRALPGVADVLSVGPDGPDGVLYVVPDGTAGLDAERLRAALRTRLGPAAAPGALTAVDTLPGADGGADDDGREAGGTEAVRAAFADLLGQPVHDDEDFFVLGGHSLLAVRLAERLREGFGVPMTGLDVMQQRTPGAVAALVRSRTADRAARERTTRPSPARSGATSSAEGAVLLTGATGGVGAFVLRELLARGTPVRALTRPESAHLLPLAGVEVVEGDLTDPDSLRAALRGTRGVIHAACTFTEPEVDRVAMAAMLDGWHDGPFVFISSTDAYGQPATADVTEDTPARGPHSGYGRAKLDCEELLLTAASTPDRPGRDWASVLRAPLVWGAHPRLREQLRWGATGSLYQAALAGRPLPLPPAHPDPDGGAWLGTAWVHAAALARASAQCLAAPLHGRANTVSGHLAWRDIAEELTRLLGTPSATASAEAEDRDLPVHLHRRRYRAERLAAVLAPGLGEDWRSALAETAGPER
ncbi:condensation domain-containing protein [Streptomyces sp. 5.8]|uniref:condensation domain-containing protein n=1 Tax=Streptomyces sp. 5.8 TaxID=3406571 RepID=UPI003BB698BD